MRSLILAGLCLATVAFGGLWLPARHSSPQSSTNTAAVESWIYGVGYVEPASEVRRLAFKTGGIIAFCNAEVGIQVHAGEPLMRLRDEVERAAERAAEAELALAQAERSKILSGVHPAEIAAAKERLAQAQAESQFSQADAARKGRLREQTTISLSELDLAISVERQQEAVVASASAEVDRLQRSVRDEDRALAEAKVQVAKAKLEMADRVVAESTLLAPCDGTVLEVLKREGDAVSAVTVEPCVLLGDVSKLVVRTEIDESFVRMLRVGQRAETRPSAERGEWRPGRINLIKPVMGNKTVFGRAANERKDLHVMQILVDLEPGFSAPIGLEMEVRVCRPGLVHDKVTE